MDVRVPLIGVRARPEDNASMMERETLREKPRRAATSEQITELRREVDSRDETIRLLNEALSRALDELTREGAAAAA